MVIFTFIIFSFIEVDFLLMLLPFMLLSKSFKVRTEFIIITITTTATTVVTTTYKDIFILKYTNSLFPFTFKWGVVSHII